MKTKIITLFILILISVQAALAQRSTKLGFSAASGSVGADNTLLGFKAGFENNGNGNTAVGSQVGMNNKGSGNSFFGSSAGHSNSGSNNTFIGELAGSASTGAGSVTAIGASAGRGNQGSGGVFAGRNAGFNNKGLNNTANGINSGGTADFLVNPGMKGELNTFLGAFSGEKNSSGRRNTYLGAESGRNNFAGAFNTYLGTRTGASSTGSNNVFIGYEAGRTTTDSHRLIIANSASSSTPLITGDFQAKHVAIGGIGDPKFTLHVLGTAHTTGTFTSSDQRFKQNIQAIDKPLEKLLAVKGVSYEFKKDATRNFPEGKTYGFIAQEVQKVLPSIVKEDKDGYLALNYECFIPLLVEGFKEMQGDYKQLSAENAKLRHELDELKKLVLRRNARETPSHWTRPENIRAEAKSTFNPILGVTLYQNEPNPFTHETSIRYQIETEAQDVTLSVYDQSGTQRLQYANLFPVAAK